MSIERHEKIKRLNIELNAKIFNIQSRADKEIARATEEYERKNLPLRIEEELNEIVEKWKSALKGHKLCIYSTIDSSIEVSIDWNKGDHDDRETETG